MALSKIDKWKACVEKQRDKNKKIINLCAKSSELSEPEVAGSRQSNTISPVIPIQTLSSEVVRRKKDKQDVGLASWLFGYVGCFLLKHVALIIVTFHKTPNHSLNGWYILTKTTANDHNVELILIHRFILIEGKIYFLQSTTWLGLRKKIFTRYIICNAEGWSDHLI